MMSVAEGLPRARLETNVYPYQSQVDNDTDLTLLVSVRLPSRLSYFSYGNFRGLTTSSDFEFIRSEQNLRWAISDSLPLDINLQGVIVDGSGNDFTQLGLGWRVHDTAAFKSFFDRLNLTYRMTIQFKRWGAVGDDDWQIEHFFKMKFPALSERLYLSGFLDQTYGLDVPDSMPKHPVVLEVQAGWRLWKRLYGVAEYRANDFRVGSENNLAVGVEYKHVWR